MITSVDGNKTESGRLQAGIKNIMTFRFPCVLKEQFQDPFTVKWWKWQTFWMGPNIELMRLSLQWDLGQNRFPYLAWARASYRVGSRELLRRKIDCSPSSRP